MTGLGRGLLLLRLPLQVVLLALIAWSTWPRVLRVRE